MDWNSFGTWLGVGVSALGVAVSVAGFWLALDQIRKTKSAVTAAREAVQRTEGRSATNTLLLLLPQLVDLERTLTRAVAAGDASGIIEQLTRWRHVAVQAKTLADRVPGDFAAFVAAVVEAIALASTAQQAISENVAITPSASVGLAGAAISAATAEAGAVLLILQLYTEDDERG